MSKSKRLPLLKIIMNTFLFILFIIGIALIFNDQLEGFLIHQNSEEYTVAKVTYQQIQENESQDAVFDFDVIECVHSEDVIEAQFDREDLPIIGGIAVPSVKINLSIFKGVSNRNLLAGAGTLDPNQKMGEGNYALASHSLENKELLFTPLEKVKENDLIYLTDLDNIYTYKVDFKKSVKPTDIHYLDVSPIKKQVTLITCGDAEGKTRIIVQGELEVITPIEEATEEQLRSFEMEQKSYYTE